MASAIVATVGSASANSYVTLAEAVTYFGDKLNVDAWDVAEPTNQTKALLMAARRLERENWIGTRVNSTQALSWPRSGAIKPDSVYGFSYNLADVYLTTEIPQPVKDAQCELALAYLNGYGQTSGGTIKSFSADGFSVSFGETRNTAEIPEEALRLIAPLIRGPQLVRA